MFYTLINLYGIASVKQRLFHRILNKLRLWENLVYGTFNRKLNFEKYSISYLERNVLIISIFIYSHILTGIDVTIYLSYYWHVTCVILAGNADSYKKELKRSLETLHCIRFPAEQ